LTTLNILNLQSVNSSINGLPQSAASGIIRHNGCKTQFAAEWNNLKRNGLNQGKLLKILTTNDTRSWMLIAGYWMLETRNWVLGIGYWVLVFIYCNTLKLKAQKFHFCAFCAFLRPYQG
jgi:hypothetical protein